MRVLSIIGTRPEALKMGPVLHAFAKTPGVESLVCVTGQHRELLRDPLDLFDVQPDHRLTITRRNRKPDALLAVLLAKLGPLIERVRPDWILAVGDTTSVLAASLAAAHHQVRFGHIEAGLRTDAKWDPFPEEFNRRLTTVLADLHFAPTAIARRNLRRENVPAHSIVVTGNPIIDTLKHFSALPPPPSLATIWSRLGLDSAIKGRAPRLLVVTFHRRENIGRPMQEICAALRELAQTHAGALKIFCIIHPNPEVREPARQNLAKVPHIVLSAPLSYPEMIGVIKRAYLVLTDSGGLQEEAPWLRVPVLVLRNRTERPEGIVAGVGKLVGTSRSRIIAAVEHLVMRPAAYRKMARGFRGYGQGRAAKAIAQALLQHV